MAAPEEAAELDLWRGSVVDKLEDEERSMRVAFAAGLICVHGHRLVVPIVWSVVDLGRPAIVAAGLSDSGALGLLMKGLASGEKVEEKELLLLGPTELDHCTFGAAEAVPIPSTPSRRGASPHDDVELEDARLRPAAAVPTG